MSGRVWDMRKDYNPSLPFIDLTKNETPLEIFTDWFNEAKKDDDSWEPNTMILSTVDISGQPSSRCVLLKQFDAEGFQFFTNYESRKAKEIGQNNRVSLLFYWAKFNRQVIIRGHAEKLGSDVSRDYFGTRPLKSEISAYLSHQSQKITEEDFLALGIESRRLYEKYTQKGESIPMPSQWFDHYFI
ncbi:Pyridoxine/pyridoxamine 5'-phosphate oxidase [Thelohanellus kitauei]|uniref:pyridoxal 5'-phosphate synthase n=1 Tax=Thelohanellus kitauei TaxID=669202 RepID=A0A0C2MXA2_THEKT|nr:Pyridoxine/pyridoxamine 5'-phosphate oxidase [Thelohanellus kitauei]